MEAVTPMLHPDTTAAELMACHECDALQQVPPLPPGRRARCTTCGHVLLRNPKGGMDHTLALFTTALVLLLLANAFPFLTLDISGREETSTLFGASVGLYRSGMGELAVVVFITSILGPALLISSCIYVLVSVRIGRELPAVRTALAWVSHLEPWGMMDVFMLGVLVSFVKLAGMADIHIGPSLYAFVALILVTASAMSHLEPELLWQRLGIPRGANDAGH
jgi:paraquat-inducible protein A